MLLPLFDAEERPFWARSRASLIDKLWRRSRPRYCGWPGGGFQVSRHLCIGETCLRPKSCHTQP